MSLILRLLFILAGAITALFVARETVSFELYQTLAAILLLTLLVGAAAVWGLRRRT